MGWRPARMPGIGSEEGEAEVNRRQLVLMGLFLGGLIVMVLFPPFFAMDITSNGQIHGVLGYFPVWEPPTQQHALAIFTESGVVPDGGVRASDLAIRRNVFRLSLSAITLFLLCLVGFALLRTGGGQRDSEGQGVGTSD